MTDAGALTCAVDERFVEIPVEGADLHAWAAETVRRGWAARGHHERDAVREVIESAWRLNAEVVRDHGADPASRTLRAWGWAPYADLVPVTLLWLDVVLLDHSEQPLPVEPDRALDLLVVDPQERFGEPLVRELDGADGPVLRLDQLVIVPSPDGDPDVHTRQQWLRPGAQPGTLVVLRAQFGSPVEAETASEAFDEVAASITVDTAA